jgi:hypothetical protein
MSLTLASILKSWIFSILSLIPPISIIKLSIDKVLDVYTEANLPIVSAFKAALKGLPCQGCKA